MIQREITKKSKEELNQLRWHRNALAFHVVFQAYLEYQNSNSIRVVNYTKNGHTSRDPAKPTIPDFCVDVELAVKKSIPGHLLPTFVNHYIKDTKELTLKEQSYIEQTIGLEFVRRDIYPLRRYFNPVRQNTHQ